MKLNKIITKSMGVVAVFAVAWAISLVANAADTHDYSTYIKLKAKTDITGGCPGASAWDPEGEMTASGYYLVPAGKKLIVRTSSSSAGGAWLGRELAIKDQLLLYGNDTRDNCATMPPLALLAGGQIDNAAGFSTVRSSTLDIRGTAENPSLITCYYTTLNDKSFLYPQLDVAFTGDADSVVVIRRTATSADFSDLQRAFRVVGGFANFFGTVIVDGARTWLRPETTATTFDIGGTLCVTNGANIYIGTVSPTFGSLVLASDATLRLASGKTVTITSALSIAEGAKIVVDSVATTAFVYDNGSNTPPKVPFLSVCGAANAAAVDRDALLAAITAGGLVFKNSLASGVPRLVLAESVRADGGVDFKVSHSPIVSQLKSFTYGHGPYGYGEYETYLSDGGEISPSKDYYIGGYKVYFKPGYEFPGRSWSVNGMVGFYNGDKLTVADLRLLGGAWVRLMKKDIVASLYGGATLYGTMDFRVFGSGTFKVFSSLRGAGDFVLTLDVDKCISESGSYLGTLSLEGDNSAWTGRALVGCGKAATENVVGLTNLTLRVASGASLGGARDEFTFDAVKIADTCTLDITNTTTFTAVNRGWCLMDGSTVNVSAGKVATMCESVTFGGASVKKGAGTLMLGGSAKFYDSVNDEAADTPNGATFRVSAGSLGVVATNALDGIGVTFASGTSMNVDVEATGDLKSFGARNVSTETPFAAVGGGAIPVSFTGAFAGEKDTVAICTISSTAATPTFALPRRYSGLSMKTAGWRTNPDGSRTFEVQFGVSGMIISFR